MISSLIAAAVAGEGSAVDALVLEGMVGRNLEKARLYLRRANRFAVSLA